MKRVIKKTPITFNGVDGWEVLVYDKEVIRRREIPCDNCMYDGTWDFFCSETCLEIHGCIQSPCTYFIFVEGCLQRETEKEI